MKNVLTVISIGFTFAAVACGSAADATGTAQQAVGSEASCWDGVTLPRPALDPVPSPSVESAVATFRAALASYETAKADYEAGYEAALETQKETLESHPDYIEWKKEYEIYTETVASTYGKPCSTNSDCITNVADFPGVCHIYYEVGQCTVDNAKLPPQPTVPLNFTTPVPVPPTQPVFSCADFTCAAGYQCELEPTTGGVACILNRCGGGPGNHGGHHR